MQLCGAWDRHDPRLLRQKPCQCYLGRRRLLPLPNFTEQINQRLVRLERLRCEAREGAAEVGAVEGHFLVHLPREKTPAQWAVGYQADAEFSEGWYHFLLRGSRPQRVFALKGGERLDG